MQGAVWNMILPVLVSARQLQAHVRQQPQSRRSTSATITTKVTLATTPASEKKGGYS